MSAESTLLAALEAGIRVRVEGDDLALEAASAPSAELLDHLARDKAAIIALLRPRADGWSAEDWTAYFQERAAIGQYDGCLARPQAEARAFAACVRAWLNLTGEASPPDRCAACGGGERRHEPLLPHCVASGGRASLHARCWPGWQARRMAAAVEALEGMGIARPVELPGDFGKSGDA